jgi:hypothetical protein
MSEEKKATGRGRGRTRLSALICITQLLQLLDEYKWEKKSQAIRGKLRLISLLHYRAANSSWRARGALMTQQARSYWAI